MIFVVVFYPSGYSEMVTGLLPWEIWLRLFV